MNDIIPARVAAALAIAELIGIGAAAEAAGLSAVCQQTARNPRTADGLHRTECLVREGMDGFHRSLKVETRVRTPLGVLVEKPQVGARRWPLTWGFAAVGGHQLPCFGIEWSAEADDHLFTRYRIDDVDLEMHCCLDEAAPVRRLRPVGRPRVATAHRLQASLRRRLRPWRASTRCLSEARVTGDVPA
jgi:hypothetical protein